MTMELKSEKTIFDKALLVLLCIMTLFSAVFFTPIGMRIVNIVYGSRTVSSFPLRFSFELGLFGLGFTFVAFVPYALFRLKRNGLANAFAILGISMIMLSLNMASPIIVDDFSQRPTHGISLESMVQIFTSLRNQYFGWGGRTIAHFYAYFFGMFGNIVFDVFNTLVFVLYCLLLANLGRKGKKNLSLWFLLSFFLIYQFQPEFGQTILWKAGACNYLWTTFTVLLFLTLFFGKERNGFLLLFLGFIAGWSNENVGVTLLAFFLYVYVLNRLTLKRKVLLMHKLAFLGLLAGTCVLLFAPGNFIRFFTEGGSGHLQGNSGLVYYVVKVVKSFIFTWRTELLSHGGLLFASVGLLSCVFLS